MMNEQIRQLAEQSRVQDRGYFIYQYGGPTGHQSVEKAIDLEKFAELLVRECADIATINQHEWHSAGSYVLKHFGFEK
jgi:hypothetical protein